MAPGTRWASRAGGGRRLSAGQDPSNEPAWSTGVVDQIGDRFLARGRGPCLTWKPWTPQGWVEGGGDPAEPCYRSPVEPPGVPVPTAVASATTTLALPFSWDDGLGSDVPRRLHLLRARTWTPSREKEEVMPMWVEQPETRLRARSLEDGGHRGAVWVSWQQWARSSL